MERLEQTLSYKITRVNETAASVNDKCIHYDFMCVYVDETYRLGASRLFPRAERAGQVVGVVAVVGTEFGSVGIGV